jgi:FkbM family methyltransferase
MDKGALKFYHRLKGKGYSAKNVCEVGVFLPQASNILGFIHDRVVTTLIEADPNYVVQLQKYFVNHKNVNIIEAAVFDFKGEIELSRLGASTFISQLKSSPALVNDSYIIRVEDKFVAESIRFSEIDHGNFDLLSVDIEGAEWYVLKHMISRPNIISLETGGKYYTNPYLVEIEMWMADNGYVVWYMHESDTIYVKNGIFKITYAEKFQLFFRIIIAMIIRKKRIFRKSKKQT